MSIRRLVPARLRHHSRVIAVQCRYCGGWLKPRHIRIPGMVCRDCETTPAFQSWKPTDPAKPARRAALAGSSRGGKR
jgi:hypothetical protein